MLKIEAVQTQAGYTDALTLGPDNFTTISLEVWNASCAVQVFQLSSHGSHQTGEWSDELILSPSTFTFTRCGGIRIRTNPKTGTPAVINAWAVKAAEPTIVAGAQNQGTLTPSSGSFTPPVTTFPYAQYSPVLTCNPTPPNVGADGFVMGWFSQIGGGLVHTYGEALWAGAGKAQGSGNYSISLPINPVGDPWDRSGTHPFAETFLPAAGTVNLENAYLGGGFVPATAEMLLDNFVDYGTFEIIYADPTVFPAVTQVGDGRPWNWGAADGNAIIWNFVYQGVVT